MPISTEAITASLSRARGYIGRKQFNIAYYILSSVKRDIEEPRLPLSEEDRQVLKDKVEATLAATTRESEDASSSIFNLQELLKNMREEADVTAAHL